MTTRKIRRPVGFNGEELSGYFMITNKDAATAILNKLTGSQLRLWLYLMMTDTYADFTRDGENVFHPLPSPAEMAIKIGVSHDTVEKDMRKLKKLELYNYRITAWQGHNLSAAKAREESKKLKNNKAQTQSSQVPGLNKPSLELNKPPERLNNPFDGLNKPQKKAETLDTTGISSGSQTIQNIHTLSDRSEGERETKTERTLTTGIAKEDKEAAQVNNDSQVNNDDQVNTHVLVKKEILVDEEISPPRTTNAIQIVVSSWLPDGPWKIDEKLEPSFRDFVAQDWVNRYGGTLYQRQADVLAHFKKDPANLPIRWEQYAREYLHRYQNTQNLLNNGVSIDEEYQKRLITNHRAVTQPLPEDLSPVGQPQPLRRISSTEEWKSQIPDGAENPQAYKPYVPPEIDDESPEVEDKEALARGKEMIAQIKAKIAQKFNMPPANPTPVEKEREMTELERLNEWIKDPILRKEVERKLRTSDRYHVEYDEEGIPYKVTELRF